MEFISIKEAIEVFGKSDSYFRRLQREWSKSKSKKVKLIDGKVKFELNELNKKFDKVSVSQRTNFDKVNIDNIMLTMLQREIDEKNELIRNQSETIKALTLINHNLTESVKTIEAVATKKRRWFW